MGIMRALTIKRASGVPTRSPSTLKGRPQISLPTELISSTNNLSYTAPSVESMQKAVAELSAAALAECRIIVSDADSHIDHTEPHTPTTPTSASYSRRSSHLSDDSEPSLTDASSVSSISSPDSPDPHHLAPNRNSYFAVDTLTKPSSNTVVIDDSVDPLTTLAPALPRRAPSHSKREHERLARRRSQRVTQQQLAASALQSRSSLDLADLADADDVFSPAPLTAAMPGLVEVEEETQAVIQQEMADVAHESQQLTQELKLLIDAVDEMSTFKEDEDTRVMRELGLKKWSVSGYLDVVGDVWGSDFFALDDLSVAA